MITYLGGDEAYRLFVDTLPKADKNSSDTTTPAAMYY